MVLTCMRKLVSNKLKPANIIETKGICGRHGSLMVSALISGSSGPGSSPGRGHCVVFLGKTLNSRSASLYPGVQMGTGELDAGGNPAMD